MVGDLKALYIGSSASGVVISGGGSVANPAMVISGMEEVAHKTLALAEECSLWRRVADPQFFISRNRSGTASELRFLQQHLQGFPTSP